jgi:hypothetical protein
MHFSGMWCSSSAQLFSTLPYTIQACFEEGHVEELEARVSILKSALQEAEAELDRVRKGKQAA